MKITPINGNTETEGAEFSYRGIPLMVARANNTEYQKRFRVLSKPYDEEIEKGTLDNDTSVKILIECCADTILVDWSDFVDCEGKEWEYNKKNAIELLTDDKDAYEAVVKFSRDINNYLVIEQKDLVGK